jgi:hypothetical protein
MNFGPLKPGEIMDLPLECAEHAHKRSTVIDDEGNIETFRVELLDSVKANPEWLKKIATYPCPFASTGQCDVSPFHDLKLLRAHLDEHFGKASKPEKA